MFPCLTKFLFIEVSNGEAEHTNHKNYTVLQRKRWRRNKGFHPVIKCLMRTKDLNGQKSPMSKSMDDELRCPSTPPHYNLSRGHKTSSIELHGGLKLFQRQVTIFIKAN